MIDRNAGEPDGGSESGSDNPREQDAQGAHAAHSTAAEVGDSSAGAAPAGPAEAAAPEQAREDWMTKAMPREKGADAPEVPGGGDDKAEPAHPKVRACQRVLLQNDAVSC